MSKYYPKLQTLYKRDKNHITNEIRYPEFNLIKKWILTEKLHGSNNSIVCRCGSSFHKKIQVRGRTDKSQLHPNVIKYLFDIAVNNKIYGKLDQQFGLSTSFDSLIEIFGEVVGKEVQGEYYKKGIGFYVFDIKIYDRFLEWSEVKELCKKLGLEHVPEISIRYDNQIYDTSSLINFPNCKSSLANLFEHGDGKSELAEKNKMPPILAEGIVVRTEPQLYNKYNERVMWKLKFKDFQVQEGEEWPKNDAIKTMKH